MSTLHQQLETKRRESAATELKANGVAGTLQVSHDARERLPRLRNEVAALETDIELGEAALSQLNQGLNNARTIANGGRELALAMTYLETAAWRMRCHLGTASEPSKPTVEAD